MKLRLVLLACCLAALPFQANLAADSDVVATVNGKPITEDTLNIYMMQKQRQMHGQQPDRNEVLKEVVDLELMVQQAEKEGLDKRPDVQKQLAFYRRGLLVNMAARDYLSKHPISEDDIKAAYEKHIKSLGSKEYHASHILVKTEDEAKDIIAQLNKKADFAELAKTKSIGPTGSKGGDLGWFSPGQMVPEFSAAVEKLKKGEYTKKPVKTQFGWHVIKLQDVRDAKPPTLEDIREPLTNQLRNEKLNAYVDSLQKDAKIVYEKK